MSTSKRKGNLCDNKTFWGLIKYKLRHWQSYRLLILLNSSLLVFNVVINSNAKTVAQEEISSNQDLSYTYVKLDGQKLFPVAPMAVTKSSDTSPSLLPMNMRVKRYEQQLQEIIRQGVDSQTLAITVSNLNGQTAIALSDKQQLPQRQINNVTELNAQIQGLSLPSLVQQWNTIIHSLLTQAQQERQPAYVSHKLLLTGTALLGMMLLCSLFLVLWQKRLKAQQEYFQLQQPILVFPQEENLDLSQSNSRQQVPQPALTVGEINPGFQEKLIAEMEQKTIGKRQKNLNVPKRELLQIGRVIVWLMGLTYMFYFWTVS